MPQTSWHEFTINCPGELIEAVTGALFSLGCTGITEEEGGSLKAYFQADADTQTVTAALKVFGGVTCSVTSVPDQDWYAGWKEMIGPYRAAGFLICPPWKQTECAPEDDEKLILLDPGQAFGTGDHESTVMVLEGLRDWVRVRGSVSSARLLDLGTGTGILSVAASLYGFGDITAADVEPKAVETARRNFELNGISDRVRLVHGSIRDTGAGYDIILANIFQEVLLELMPDIPAALKPGGSVIMSGLLAGQETTVNEAAKANGLELAEMIDRNGWVCLRLSAPGSR